jgi:leader peptidase (prepilin peptidase)/N-methyltransferase
MSKLQIAEYPIGASLALSGLYTLLAISALADTLAPVSILVASVVLAASLVALSVIDLQTMRLPDLITLPLIAAGLLLAIVLEWPGQIWHFAAAAAGYLFLSGLGYAYRAWRHRAGLGLGDAKLFAAAGAWLGPAGLPSVLVWACGAALVAVAIHRIRGQTLSRTSRIAFGPFLAFGFWIVWLFGPFA